MRKWFATALLLIPVFSCLIASLVFFQDHRAQQKVLERQSEFIEEQKGIATHRNEIVDQQKKLLEEQNEFVRLQLQRSKEFQRLIDQAVDQALATPTPKSAEELAKEQAQQARANAIKSQYWKYFEHPGWLPPLSTGSLPPLRTPDD